MESVEKESIKDVTEGAKEAAVASDLPVVNDEPEAPTWTSRAYRWLLIGGFAYMAFLALLLVPVIQRNAIFMHNVRIPLWTKFAAPERYGLAPFKTRNLAITTADGETLGAWHTLPNTIYRSQLDGTFPPTAPFDEGVFDEALRARPTVLFLHGNAGNRALSLRTSLLSSLSTALDVNALIIDYRGFGDSTGSPTEAGLLLDARAAWDWIVARNGGDASKVAIVGQSLGTGVGSALAAQLIAEDIHPPVVALLSAFSSVPELLRTYSLFRLFPILSPMRALPLAQAALTSPRLLQTRFDSLSTLRALPASSPTTLLLAHARNDGEIPLAHGQALFDGLLETALGGGGRPRARADSMSIEAIELYRLEWDAWRAREAERTERTVVPGWGEIKRFARADDGKTGQVVFLEALAGGHDSLGGSEGVVALLGSVWAI